MTKRLMLTFVLMATVVTAGWAETHGRCGNMKGRGHGGGRGGGSCGSSLAALPVEDLSANEKSSLLLMREEEKLARDVYLALGQKFDLPVFSNIPRAEQRHMDRMGDLLERYGLDDPIVDDKRGQFSNPELQVLFDELVKQGSVSEIEALKVGATIEDLDIHDLETALAGDVDNQDIISVYRNLAKGSRNHMRAFASQLKSRGVEYRAQYIAQDDLDAIVNSDWEHGSGQGKARGGRSRSRSGR